MLNAEHITMLHYQIKKKFILGVELMLDRLEFHFNIYLKIKLFNNLGLC